ncbi:phosphate ABC transporter substrate-binding protein PstS family protein [Streptomyces sp. NBC_01803]|uniref:phosphate ABC transporter substrate-binding protein PstS family protein n=1 Tax=Streptomyces sp. NBC_01803 TaxID=2975946 RepID=UPI002DDB38BA|nr:phosphate ABC transporter substrate-binding protein PstS family protein [Streptomyces sp. NBC_01803]WSA42996.1 phosphate ABC transporter substrate-binding protein PstS family protein [Streptomyces sp. NBC_01803]
MRNWRAKTAVIVAVSALALSACSSDDSDESGNGGSGGDGENLSGDIAIDGSSTVAPLSEAAAQLFMAENPDVRISVGTSGTGGGFEKFCNGETDLSDASREIEEDEIAACEGNGIGFDAVQVANDALSIIVNPNNPVECLTVEQARQIWDQDSPVSDWSDIEGVDAGDLGEVTLYGPGTDSGTFDYFTEAINGEEGRIRTDYTDIGEDDQAAITGVEGDEAAMAFVPYSFVQQAGDAVKSLQIDNGEGCVDATLENVQSGSYAPLGRALYVYGSDQALAKPEVVEFLRFYLDNSTDIAEAATFVPMTQEQIDAGHATIEELAGS